MLKGEGAERPRSLCAKGPPEESSHGGSHEGGAPVQPPTWKHVNRSRSPHLRQGPGLWGGTARRTFLCPVSNCFHKPLAPEANKSERCLFLPACSGTELSTAAPQHGAARNESHMFTLPALAHASSVPGKMCAPLPACGTVGGGCALIQGKRFPQTTHSVTLTHGPPQGRGWRSNSGGSPQGAGLAIRGSCLPPHLTALG